MQRKKILEHLWIVLGVSCFVVIVLFVQIFLSFREQRSRSVSDAISERFDSIFSEIKQTLQSSSQSSSDKQ